MIDSKVKIKVKEYDYPILMINNIDSSIVLFIDETFRVPLVDGVCCEVNYVPCVWSIQDFSPFNGEVTIKNK